MADNEQEMKKGLLNSFLSRSFDLSNEELEDLCINYLEIEGIKPTNKNIQLAYDTLTNSINEMQTICYGIIKLM